MKPIMSLERRDAILALSNKRTQIICALLTDHVPVYWYDAETQSMVWDYANKLVFCIDEQETPYQGQRLYCSAIDYYALEQLGTFNAIQTVMEYERTRFGQVAPAENYGSACWVANMVVYILGEALIYHLFGDDGDFQTDSGITPETAQRYSIMLDKILAEEPDLIANLWKRP